MKKPRKPQTPIVIDTSSLHSQDLGKGWTLKFQRSTKDPKQVRAVITTDKGEVWAKGDVVDESNALASRISALANIRHKNYNLMHGLPADATKEDQLKNLEEMALRMGFTGF